MTMLCMTTSMVSFRLNDVLLGKLDELAHKKGLKRSALLVWLVQRVTRSVIQEQFAVPQTSQVPKTLEDKILEGLQ